AFVLTSLAVPIISYPLDDCVPGNYGIKYSTVFWFCWRGCTYQINSKGVFALFLLKEQMVV
ncbi:hypothetical protein, partial [Cronobacter sakazakii]